jgi:hypothetical protein
MMTKLIPFILIAVATANLSAQTQRILIPYVVEGEIAGAFGSVWTTDLALLNDSGEAISIIGYEPRCQLSACEPDSAGPGITFYPSFRETRLSGMFLTVTPGDLADRVVAKLRSRDLSRQAEAWGTEIPTIRESDAPVGRFQILDIPTDPRYRAMLRLYSFHSEPIAVRVRFYATRTAINRPALYPVDELLAEETMTLQEARQVSTFDAYPGYAEIPWLTQRHAALPQSERVRIEVTSLSEGARIWGFVTVTNNETQHVTVMSP